MWPEGDKPRYYQVGGRTMIVPPNIGCISTFNTGTTPARYLASSTRASRSATPRASEGWISKRLGGDQIDYSDENPETRKDFEARTRPGTAQVRHGQSLAAGRSICR